MTMPALKSHDIGQPDAETIASLLHPDYAKDAIARFCGAEAHLIERVHFSTSRPLSIQYCVRLPDGIERTVLAQWVGREAVSFALAETDRLRKSRRSQLHKEATGALLGDPASGLVLRHPGFDGRLPGLRLLHDGQAARDFAQLPTVSGPVDVTLRAHRLGKRAVLQVGSSGSAKAHSFVRLRPVSSTAGQRAYDRHVALFERVGGAITLPMPFGYDSDLGASAFSALRGGPPTFQGDEPAQIVEALRRLQRVEDLPVHRHTAADEVALLAEWCDRVCAVFPDRAGYFSRALDRVCHDLFDLPAKPPVPCHRDFHAGQIMIDGDRVGLLDFDTLRLSDPALDPGNLIAHLRLAGFRSGCRLSAVEAAIIEAMGPVSAERISVWTRASLLRLAAIYAFTSEPRQTQDLLLDHAM